MKRFFEEATEIMDQYFKYYGDNIFTWDDGYGRLFKAAAEIIRDSLGDEEADAFLAVVASGSLKMDLDKEDLWFESNSGLVEEYYNELKSGKPLYLSVCVTDKTLVWTDYDEAEIQESYEHHNLLLEDDDRLKERSPWLAEKPARLWESLREEEEERKRKEERDARLRSLVDEVGETRTGDEKIDALIAIVREIVNEKRRDGGEIDYEYEEDDEYYGEGEDCEEE